MKAASALSGSGAHASPREMEANKMQIMRSLRRLLSVAAVAASAFVAPQVQAAPGLLILEGSDAQTFHGLEPYSTDFLNGLASFSANASAPIAVFGFNPTGLPTVGKVSLGGVLPSLSVLESTYSGLY